MSASMDRFDWINQIKEQTAEIKSTGLTESATAEVVLTVPEGLDIESLDQVHLSLLMGVLTEEHDATLGI